MRLLADAGCRRNAPAAYEQLREALRRDTGADPGPQTRDSRGADVARPGQAADPHRGRRLWRDPARTRRGGPSA
ncbi:hypothetical protein [Streptomyces sp. NPDC002671]